MATGLVQSGGHKLYKAQNFSVLRRVVEMASWVF